jgi:hypothetical protein
MKVRYAVIDPQRIQARMCRNEHYNNNHVEYMNWCINPLLVARKPKLKLQEALTEDVRRHGYRNPIVAYAMPEGMFLQFGGCRLRAAHDLGLTEIPCIVNDITGEFDDCPEVTEDNWTTFFKDTPVWHSFTETDGFETHNGLERMRRDEWLEDSRGFDWLVEGDYDMSFVEQEMAWSADILELARKRKKDKRRDGA